VGDWLKGGFTKGTWLFANGDIYEGTFAKNKPDGQGKFMFFKSKGTTHGKFEKGRWIIGNTSMTPAKIILQYMLKASPSIFASSNNPLNQPSSVIPMRFL
jgi:hypothetical protein